MGAVFQASDLSQRGRAVLNAARTGEARLRDHDGLDLVMLPEARVQALRAVASAAASLALLEAALAVGTSAHLTEYGDWPWLRHLPDSDLPDFIADLRAALIVAAREERAAPLDDTLYTWRASADALADPDSRAILLGSAADDDFVEVALPDDNMPSTGRS